MQELPQDSLTPMTHPDLQNRTVFVKIRVSPHEKATWEEAAENLGLNVSTYVRQRVARHKIVSRFDRKLVLELRRSMGLCKHLIMERPEFRAELNAVFNRLDVLFRDITNANGKVR